MTLLAGVMAAGALGAAARYALDYLVVRRAGGVFPWGTLVVNLTGSLALGVVTGLTLRHGLDEAAMTVVASGFLGAYTTFSTFAYETLRLISEGARGVALVNAAGTLLGGTAAAAAGVGLAAV